VKDSFPARNQDMVLTEILDRWALAGESERGKMRESMKTKQSRSIPKDAVLLIPEAECENDLPTCGVQPGYYNAKQMLELIEKHMKDADAIQFIADMLESGDPDNDGFVKMLRSNRHNPGELQRILKICNE
jgi:hypothetical protein